MNIAVIEKKARLSAMVDLGLFAILATPGISKVVLLMMLEMSERYLNLSVEVETYQALASPVTQLCLCLFGLFGVSFSLCRLNSPATHLRLTALTKALAVLLFIMGFYQGLPWVFLLFALADVVTGTQHYTLYRYSTSQNPSL